MVAGRHPAQARLYAGGHATELVFLDVYEEGIPFDEDAGIARLERFIWV